MKPFWQQKRRFSIKKNNKENEFINKYACYAP